MRIPRLTEIVLLTSLALGASACGGPGKDTRIEEVEYPSGETSEDPQNTGTPTDCTYEVSELPYILFDSINFNPEDIATLHDARLEGGVTVGDVVDESLASHLVYDKLSMKAMYDAVPEVRQALYDDLSLTLCGTNQADKESTLDQFLRGIFDDATGGEQSFVMRERNSAYFARVTGNDGTERTYMLLLGDIVAPQGDQEDVPTALVLVPADSITALMKLYVE